MNLTRSQQRRLVEEMGLPLDKCLSAHVDLDGWIVKVTVTYTRDWEWLKKVVEIEQSER